MDQKSTSNSIPQRSNVPIYRAFISYSHAADGKLAPALQSALQGFTKPWYRLRSIRIFRDKTSLSANPSLWTAIERALQDSEWFLLMASVDSAKSHWVEQELHWWFEHRSADRMLIVLTDGELVWDENRSDFNWQQTTALGQYLSGKLEREPLYVDLRWAKSIDNLSLRHSQFRAAVLDLAAPLYGRAKDDLDGENVRQHRRTRRVAWSAGIVLIVLTITSLVAAGMAIHQAKIAEERRQEAERERQIAVSRQLAAQSEIMRGQRTDLLPTSLLLAIESLHHGFSLEAVQSLQKGLQLLPQRGSVVVKHSENANDAVLTPDGRLLITASDDGTARTWDTSTGSEQSRFEVGGRVMQLHLSQDGKRLATQGYGSTTVRAWELSTGKEIGRFDHPAPIDTVALSPDGTKLATGARDNRLRIWDVISGSELLQLPHQNWVAAVAFAPDGSRVVSGSADKTTRLWDVASGNELWRVQHTGEVEAVAYSPDGKHVATGGWDLQARVLDVSNGREIAHSSHSRVVTKVDYSTDGRLLAVASDDGAARVIEASSGKEINRFAPEGGVLRLAFSPDGRLLGTIGLSLAAHVWEVQSKREVTRVPVKALPDSIRFGSTGNTLIVTDRDGTAQTLHLDDVALLHGEALQAAAFSPDGRFVAMARKDHEVLVSRIDSGGPIQRLNITEPPDYLLLTSDGKKLITQNNELGILRVWDTSSGRSLWKSVQAARDRPWARRPAMSPDGRYLTISHNQAQVLDIVSVDTGRIVAFVTHDESILDSGFSPDGRFLVTTGAAGAWVWESAGGKLRYHLAMDDNAIGAGFSPDGKLLATTSENGLTRLWDMASGKELRRFEDNEPVITVTFSPDGKMLATSSITAVRLWQVDTGKEIGRLHHDGATEFIAFSPDGRYLATGSRDHSARVWEVSSRLEVARMSDEGAAFSVAFDATGRYLLVEHTDAASRFWRAWLWRPTDLEAESCARLSKNLNREEWQRYLNNEPYRPTCPQLPAGP